MKQIPKTLIGSKRSSILFGVIGGFEARIDDDLKITVYAFRRSYLKG